ncbi:MAG: VWA domain-containing protein [Deltaproteobacteria bacterium]|nr:VWA domain-containing protein [Deltaproteobacteria bacterium]
MLRITDELLWMLRRSGFAIATSQAIDAVRAIRAVGLDSKELVREALACVVAPRPRDRARFDHVVDAFFAREPRRTLWERLAAEGFDDHEIAALRELLDALAAASPDSAVGPLVHRGAELDRLLQLAGATQMLSSMQSPLQAGFYTQRLLEHVGTWRAQDELSALRTRLSDALSAERADAMLAILKREVQRAAEDVRDVVQSTLARRDAEADRGDDVLGAPFAALDPVEVDEVRRAVRAFVQRLRGGERVRKRRAMRGRIDPHATLRRAMRTGGVPFRLSRRARRRDKPRLLLLCDVSDSVRSVARFLLELTYAAQELFDRTRSFVFVSELGETTRLFEEEPIERALAKAYGGAVVPVTHNSSYGRVLRSFEERVLRDVDRRTTVVILGDGRTNYQDDGAAVLDAIRARARAVVWLCPEPRAAWATGDSAMSRYAPKCTRVLEVRCARDLEDAARLLLSLR